MEECSINRTNYQKHKAKAYNKKKLVLFLIETLIAIFLLLALLLSGLSTRFENFAAAKISHPYLILLLYVVMVGLVELLVLFPFNFYSSYVLEHKYNLSNQSLGKWVWEEAKALLVTTFIFIPVILLFFFFLRNFGDFWWFPVGGILFVVSVLLAKLAPVVIFPIFYKFELLDDQNLKKRVLALCENIGLKVEGVFRFNLSKDTRKANAGFVGLGKTKRIILSDTLLENFSEEEIETVFAHELGHYKYGHIWKGILIGLVSIFVGLYIMASLYKSSLAAFGFSRIDQVAALPLLALYATLFGLITMPLQNFLSRRFEQKADRFSVQLTLNREAFVSTMKKLAAINLSDMEPNPVVEFLFYSHPSPTKRIRAIESIPLPL